MKELLAIFKFLQDHCDSIELDRETAIKLHSKYRVYLDIEHGYPQVKIIAPKGEDYDLLDKSIDESQQLPILAIHDNYSFYQEFNDNTYTLPLTRKNFEFLNALLSSKSGFQDLENYFNDFKASTVAAFTKDYQRSAGYQLFLNILNYGLYLVDDEPLVTINDIHRISHMEQVKNLQTRLMSDPITPCFFDDNDRVIFNDLLEDTFRTTFKATEEVSILDTMDYYSKRKQFDTSSLQHAEKKQDADDFLGNHPDIFLTAVKLKKPGNIFVDYALPAYQCQNAVYLKQTCNNQQFNDRLAKDEFLSGLSLPSHSDIVKYLEGNREPVVSCRWTILEDFSPDSDLDHQGWQWHIYYQKVDDPLREVFQDMGGHELLADSDKTNHVLMIPYQYYTLLVLLHHLKMKTSKENQLLEKIQRVISKYNLSSVPEILIKEMEKTDSHLAQNFYQMHQTQLRAIDDQRRLYSLELAQSQVQELQDDKTLDRGDSLIFRTPVYDEGTACYQTIMISGICDQKLLEFINFISKSQAGKFTMATVIKQRRISERNSLTELKQKIGIWLQSDDNVSKKDIDIPCLMPMKELSFFYISDLQNYKSFEQKRKLYQALMQVNDMRDIHSDFLISNLELGSPGLNHSFFKSGDNENADEQNSSSKCCTIS